MSPSVTTVGEMMWLLTTISYTTSSTLEMLELAGNGSNDLVNELMKCVSRVELCQTEYLFLILPVIRCIGMDNLVLFLFLIYCVF